ncbi:hypothetical protein, partial [Frankia sp. AvcI1]
HRVGQAGTVRGKLVLFVA